jgi:hypothetical protein
MLVLLGWAWRDELGLGRTFDEELRVLKYRLALGFIAPDYPAPFSVLGW